MTDTTTRPTWISGPQLRARWGGMANSTFYDRLQKGLIPKPYRPFGSASPFWLVSEIEAHEQQATQAKVAA